MRREIILVLILAVAAAVRIAYLADIWKTPVADVPVIDSEYYHYWAAALAKGESGEEGVFFMSPLYPHLLSFLYRTFGVDPRIPLLFQALGGVLLVYMLYLLGVQLFSRKAGLIAASIAALYQPFIYYEGVLLSAVVILLLNAAALLLLLRQRPDNFNVFFAALLLGLSALARPLVLLFAGILLLYYLITARKGNLLRPVLLLLGLLIILIPVSYRNYRVAGEWVLTTAGGGMNFYAGNNPDAEGIYWEAPFLRSAEPQYENEDYRLEASRRSGENLSVSAASRYWFGQGIGYIFSDPLDYLQLLMNKLFLFFHQTEIPNNLSLYAARDFSRVLPLIPFTFGLIAPFGFAFWLISLKGSRLWLIHLYGLSYFLGTMLFFAASEYRLPMLLLLIPFAAGGLLELLKHLKEVRWRNFAWLFASVLLLAVPINMTTSFTDTIASTRMDYFNLGSVLQKQHRNMEAAGMFNRALLIDPEFAEAHIALGDSYHALEQFEQAAEEFRRGGLDPEFEFLILDAENLFRNADSQATLGDFEAARQSYNRGIAMHPDPPVYAYYNMAYLSLQLGDTLRAADEARIAHDLDPDEPKILYLQGWIEEKRGNWKAALHDYLSTLELNPVFHEARAHAALICLHLDDRSQAAQLIEPLLGRSFKSRELYDLVQQIAAQVGY